MYLLIKSIFNCIVYIKKYVKSLEHAVTLSVEALCYNNFIG
jgi:hypothetical protein